MKDDWRKNIGKYIEWVDGEPVEITFLHDEPRQTSREYKGVKRDAWEWDVMVGNSKKILTVSAFGFLNQLRAIPSLTAQPIRVARSGKGTETTYKVDVQKKLA